MARQTCGIVVWVEMIGKQKPDLTPVFEEYFRRDEEMDVVNCISTLTLITNEILLLKLQIYFLKVIAYSRLNSISL